MAADLLAGLIIGLHLASAHVPEAGMNNVTPGIYVKAPSGLTAGAFHNSLRRTSVYAGWTVAHEVGAVEASLTVGAITGYRKNVVPLIAPSVAVGVGSGVSTRLSCIPAALLGDGSPNVIHLSIEKKF